MERLKMRLTDPDVAANLRENVKELQKVGIQPEISALRYIKLAEYEDKESDQQVSDSDCSTEVMS